MDYRRLRNPVFAARLGHTTLPDDDPAEVFHEASCIGRRYRLRDLAGALRPEEERALAEATTHRGKRHPYVELRELSEPRYQQLEQVPPRTPQPTRGGGGRDVLAEQHLSAILHAGYGELGAPERRFVPSAGDVYPLDVYVVCDRVGDVSAGLYRYEPSMHGLERLGTYVAATHVASTFESPEDAIDAACFIVLATIFWRSRLTHGPRGYRNILLEAGHVMQSMMATAALLDVVAVPVAEFYDHELADALRMDGVTEAPLYLAALAPGALHE